MELNATKKAPHLRGKVNVYCWSTGNVIKAEIVNIPQGALRVELCNKSGFSTTLNVYNGYCFAVLFAGKLRDHRFKLKYNDSDLSE